MVKNVQIQQNNFLLVNFSHIFFSVKIDHFVEDKRDMEDLTDPVEYDVGFTGSDFDEVFYLDSIHFHWGEKINNTYLGSEHTVGHSLDDIQYPLEVVFF